MEKPQTPDGQRIIDVFKWSKCATINKFATELGFERAEKIYRILRGKNGISREVADAIVQRYNRVNLIWLLQGDGNMILSPDSNAATWLDNNGTSSEETYIDLIKSNAYLEGVVDSQKKVITELIEKCAELGDNKEHKNKQQSA